MFGDYEAVTRATTAKKQIFNLVKSYLWLWLCVRWEVMQKILGLGDTPVRNWATGMFAATEPGNSTWTEAAWNVK